MVSAMKNQAIFEAAVRLICETPNSEQTADYTDRAPYILASLFSEAAATDAKYRLSHKLEKSESSPTAYADLDASCPLSDAFFHPAVYYLASMLVLEENEELSERLFAKYSDGMALICAELPATATPISDRYRLLSS